jgi:hypothetical protein
MNLTRPMDAGEYARAKSGVTMALMWLRYELGVGPLWPRIPVLAQLEQRRRVRYAGWLERLERLELLAEQLNRHLGLTVLAMTDPGAAPDSTMPAAGCPFLDDVGVYVLGALDPAEREQLQAHLPSCERCREQLARLADLPPLLAALSAGQAIAVLNEVTGVSGEAGSESSDEGLTAGDGGPAEPRRSDPARVVH